MRDVYAEATAKIIAELEKGAAPWVKPWNSGARLALPFNAATGKKYRGVNVPLLLGAAADYGAAGFVTFKQAQALGGHVRKGERGHLVIFWNFVERETESDDGDETTTERIGFARAYTVFNVAQCDGLPQSTAPAAPAPINPDSRDAALDAAIANLGARIHHGSDSAFYRPSTDSVHMPDFGQFKDASNYYATLLHELTHWTAPGARCGRDLSGRFGDASYAAEELVAELGAAFLCADHGVRGEVRHAGYIGHWLKVLKADKRALFTAASKAQQAADYLNAGMVPLAIAA